MDLRQLSHAPAASPSADPAFAELIQAVMTADQRRRVTLAAVAVARYSDAPLSMVADVLLEELAEIGEVLA